MFLGSEEIKKLILKKEMIRNYGNLDEQLQPNGFDLRVEKVEKEVFKVQPFILGRETKKFPEMANVNLTPEKDSDWWFLKPGKYLIYFIEEVNLPKDIAAVTIQRSSVMRGLEETIVGSWDAGYNGKGCNKLTVDSESGMLLQYGARVVQMHFIPVSGENFSYNGSYQKENLNGIK